MYENLIEDQNEEQDDDDDDEREEQNEAQVMLTDWKQYEYLSA